MNIKIKSIMFNHSQNKSVSALNIKKNFTTLLPLPEWVGGSSNADARVAYSISDTFNKDIKIIVTFETDCNQNLKIRTRGGDILGEVSNKTINFASGLNRVVSIDLTKNTFPFSGILKKQITWNWEYEDGKNWILFDTTQFTLYTLLNLPNKPWTQTNFNQSDQFPWTDLLDIVCNWAQGCKTSIEIESAITKGLFDVDRDWLIPKISYDVVAGASHFTTPNVFYCSRFIAFLNSSQFDVVNCTDCAAIVSTFTNILGCSLYQAKMHSDNNILYVDGRVMPKGFKLRPIMAIGHKSFSVPFNGYFSYHEVAWKDPCEANSRIYDACLKLKSNEVAVWPINMVFGTNIVERTYRWLIATPDSDGYANCQAQPLSKIIRNVV